jgi:LasA protease
MLKKRLFLALLLVWIIPALACNVPTGPAPVTPSPRSAVVPSATSPTPLDAWKFPGLDILRGFPENSAAGALELFNAGSNPYPYVTQPGDTLAALSRRFAVLPENIRVPGGISNDGYLPPGTHLEIGVAETWTLPSAALLPDSEIVYGPSTAGFSAADYIHDAGAFLNSYSEIVDGQMLSGAEIVERVAQDTSTNPRILLAMLEYRSGWVLGWPKQPVDTVYPIGFGANDYRGLYKELILVARQLSLGYYGWRQGQVASLDFPHGSPARLSPSINAGSAAVSVLFSKLYNREDFGPALYGARGFIAFYTWLFGDPWARAAAYEPLLKPNFLNELPSLELPFAAGERWNFTGGPHADWGSASPSGALDFAPSGEGRGCYISKRWVTASAAGIVVRSGNGQVLLDLDGDGQEGTGWVLLYLHLADQDRAAVGTHVQSGDPLGHASCEGGVATGTNIHIARKYNGEWIGCGSEAPFVLSGWRAEAGSAAYLGQLVNQDGTAVNAKADGSGASLIVH